MAYALGKEESVFKHFLHQPLFQNQLGKTLPFYKMVFGLKPLSVFLLTKATSGILPVPGSAE